MIIGMVALLAAFGSIKAAEPFMERGETAEGIACYLTGMVFLLVLHTLFG